MEIAIANNTKNRSSKIMAFSLHHLPAVTFSYRFLTTFSDNFSDHPIAVAHASAGSRRPGSPALKYSSKSFIFDSFQISF